MLGGAKQQRLIDAQFTGVMCTSSTIRNVGPAQVRGAQHRPALVDAQLGDILVVMAPPGPSVLTAQNLPRGNLMHE